MWADHNFLPSIDLRFINSNSDQILKDAGINVFKQRPQNFDGALVDV